MSQTKYYQGTEVFKFRAEDHPDQFHWEKLQPIQEREGLVAGDVVLIPALIGEGFFPMTVQEDLTGPMKDVAERVAESQSGKWRALLNFGKDDRKSWVCTGLLNTRGLEKLQVTL